MTELKIKAKLTRGGNAWVFRVPKTYVDDGNLTAGEEYELAPVLVTQDTDAVESAELPQERINAQSVVQSRVLVDRGALGFVARLAGFPEDLRDFVA